MGLILYAGLCKMCPDREWGLPDEFTHFGWHWCKARLDMVHDTMGCDSRRFDLRPKRVPLAVRLGLKPNNQGEYLTVEV